MEATLLNEKFEAISIIDTYKSFIWTDRYNKYGDFEIHIPMNISLLSLIKKGQYLWNANSEHLMIVETIGIKSDEEQGNYFTISGRSLESLLKRRIVWTKTTFNDGHNLQKAIRTLLEANVIKPSIAARAIPNFIFEESDDEKITSLEIEAQYFGDDLYEVISNLCLENDIGFKITLNSDNQFVFKLYAGADRSYEQTTNPYVIFSPEYDNVSNTNYIDSDEAYKNVTLVAGEGDDKSRTTYVLGVGAGLDRREIFTDASGITSDDGNGGTLTAEQYRAHLKKSGIDTLMANVLITSFDAEVDPSNMFVYGEDFFIGDIVQMANEYGQEGRSYISEVVMTCDESGTFMYPTFETIQEGVYET